MWWSMVVQLRGQSMQEASAHPEQFLCCYDGSVYGDRQAKKMAKKVGRDYIFKGANVGQPRLVKTPMEPFGKEELAEVADALERGLVPPGMTLEAAQQLRDMTSDDPEEDGDRPALDAEAAAVAHRYGIDFYDASERFAAEFITPMLADAAPGEFTIVPDEESWRMCRVWILGEAEPRLMDEVGLAEVYSAMSAVSAAQVTGDEPTMAAAYAHYDRMLENVIAKNGLEALVEVLRERFFSTSSTDDT
jgi:hypothetical protein